MSHSQIFVHNVDTGPKYSLGGITLCKGRWWYQTRKGWSSRTLLFSYNGSLTTLYLRGYKIVTCHEGCFTLKSGIIFG